MAKQTRASLEEDLTFLFENPNAEDDLLKRYLQCVVWTDRFRGFRSIVHDSGPKAGGNLWGHILNGVFVMESLKKLLGLTLEDRKILFAAYTLHDINKILQDRRGESFGRLAISENLEEMAAQLGIPDFFPEYRNERNWARITGLVQRHSGQLGYGTDSLFSGAALDDRFKRLLRIVQAVDKLDNSSSVEERRFKDEVLERINASLQEREPLRWIHHRLPENRGLLTNVIHNRTVEVLEARGATPVLFYGDGVAYLWPCSKEFPDAEELGREVAGKCVGFLRTCQVKNFTAYVKKGPQGIKVDGAVLEMGVPFGEIWTTIRALVAKSKSIDLAQKYIDEAATKYRAIYGENGQVPEWSIPERDEVGRTGELLRSYYIFLKKHFSKQFKAPWPILYDLVELPREDWELCDFFDPNYARGYLVAGALARAGKEVSPDGISRKIVHHAESQLFSKKQPLNRGDSGTGESEWSGDEKGLAKYVESRLQFSFAPPPGAFGEVVERYRTAPFSSCCFCAADEETGAWTAGDSPPWIKPQKFSNRRPGGGKERSGSDRNPVVKGICPICKLQYKLEKLSDPVSVETPTHYLHLFPVTYVTRTQLQILRQEQAQLLGREGTFFLQMTKALEILRETGQYRLPFKVGKKFGLVTPRFSETIGAYLPLSLHEAGDNDTMRYLALVLDTLLIQRVLGLKALLTEQPLPPLGPGEFGLVYLDGISPLLRGLLGDDPDFSAERVANLWLRLAGENGTGGLLRVAGILWKKGKLEEKLLLIRSLADSPWRLFWEIDRLVERKAEKNEAKARNLIGEVMPHVRTLVDAVWKGGGKRVSIIQDLANKAWEGRILPQGSYSRNALQRPLQMIFNELERKSPHATLADLRAALVEKIFNHLERTANEGYKPGRTKFGKVREYVEAFFRDLLEGQYKGSLAHLLKDRKLIVAAYTCFLREAMDLSFQKKRDTAAPAVNG